MIKKTCSRRRKEKMREEEERIRLQILAHAQSLAEEMNLRMFLKEDGVLWEKDALLKEIPATAGEKGSWGRLYDPPRALFVESVTVTDIVFPERRVGFFRKIGRIFMRLLRRLRTLLPMKSGNRPITNK